MDDGASQGFDWDLWDGTNSSWSNKGRKWTKRCSDCTVVSWIMLPQNINVASVFTDGCFLYPSFSVQDRLRKLSVLKDNAQARLNAC